MDVDISNEVKGKVILHWNYRNLVTFPEELREGKHIQEIYLKWNRIPKLPIWLGCLKKLTNLYICGNELNSLPEEIVELESLSCLDVAWNKLASLPLTICQLSQLSVLNASENCLTHLPDEISNLTVLKVLIISGNKLTCLPDSLCHCHDLEEICIDDNFLTHLPHKIVYLKNLQFLSVIQNQINYLPALPFTSSPQLRFEGNPCLNHVTYWLGSQMSYNENHQDTETWAFETTGCFLSNAENITNRNITVLCPNIFVSNGDNVRLVLPQGLLEVRPSSQNSREVTSLYELTIRKVYQSLYNHKIKTEYYNGHCIISMIRYRKYYWEKGIFPRGIEILLSNGPTTICSNTTCDNPIFSYALMSIVQKLVMNRFGNIKEILSTLFFCSETCFTHHINYDLLPQVEWQLDAII